MEGVQVDWLVVLVAALMNMMIGFVWYSRWLFGKVWLKLSHLSEKEMRGRGTAVCYGFIVSLCVAFFLAFFEGYLGVTTVSDGMFIGFCLWVGFVATTQISQVIWGKGSLRLFFINSGYQLLSYLVMSGIIGA